MLLPLFSVLVGRFILAFVVDVYLRDTGQYIWNVHGEYEWLKIIYQVVSFSAVLLTLVVYQKIREAKQREKEDAVLLIPPPHGLKTDFPAPPHGCPYHAAILSLRDKALPLRGYVFQSSSAAPKGLHLIVLAEKKRQAKEEGIAFESGFHYPQDAGLNAFDISVILNNSLANALEAARTCDIP